MNHRPRSLYTEEMFGYLRKFVEGIPLQLPRGEIVEELSLLERTLNSKNFSADDRTLLWAENNREDRKNIFSVALSILQEKGVIRYNGRAYFCVLRDNPKQ